MENKLTPEQVRQVARLARLALTDEEIQRLTTDLNALLAHFGKLQELDTEAVPPTFHVLHLSNVTREDEVLPSLPAEEVVANAPQADGPFFVVPRIVNTD